MGAPRKYSQSQRDAIYRLALGGLASREIAERCAAGIEDKPRFDISPRTVRAIVLQERQRRPTSDPRQDPSKDNPRESVLVRLERAEREGRLEPEPLPAPEGHHCSFCYESAMATRRNTIGQILYLCVAHFEREKEAGRVETVPDAQPTLDAAEVTATRHQWQQGLYCLTRGSSGTKRDA